MLDVQRVAGNFHISVHGLNIFVAEKVSNPKFQILKVIVPFEHFDYEVCVFSLHKIKVQAAKKLNYNSSDYVILEKQ